MEFGIQIEPQVGFTYADVLAIAQAAEGAGFTSLWASDHLFLAPDSVDTNCLEAWTLLAALAQGTTTLRLGTLVTSQSYRNPALLAKIAAGVDHISGGRLEFGIGAGWKEVEYRAYGYPFPGPGVRIEQLVDALEIVRRMWTEERATYEGRHYHVRDALCAPKPVQRPHPRIWIGGNKPRMMRVAARYADAVNLQDFFAGPAAYDTAMGALRRGCREAERDPATVLLSHCTFTVIGETEAEVAAIVEDLARQRGTTREQWLAQRGGATVGTPDQVVERLRQYAGVGISYAILLFPYRREREMLRLVAESVIPALR